MKKWIALLSAFMLTLSCAMAESSDTAKTETLSFDANPTTGYSWLGFVLGGEAVQLDSAEGTYIPEDQTGMLCGAGGQTKYVVTAVKPGRSVITFDYRRSWENTSLTQKVYLAVVDQELNLSLMDVTDTGVLQGTVLSIDEDKHTAMIEHDTIGEILARFSPEMSLPTVDEQIVIYTDGTMTLSLPAMMNVLAWCCIPPAEARNEAEPVQSSSFAEMTGLSSFLSRVTDDNPIVSVSFSDGYSGLAPEYSTDSPDEIQKILDAVLAMEIGDVSDVYVTDWDPVLHMTSADGQCWAVAFNGHWLPKNGANYNLIHDEEFWKLAAKLRRASGTME
ncbi:MAG: protease inhibitor I42 family protein [Clostridiales bacterium]|nr:protease inhibitor I42 family protein [Clostridiales bacterium]